MKLRKFNAKANLKSLNKRNNREASIKKRTIILSIFVVVLGVIYFTFARFENKVSFTIVDGKIGNFHRETLVDTIIRLASEGATDLRYDGTDTLGEYGTNDNNLRYVGSSPNNYIYFNCSTTDFSQMNDETCEKWRIIGVMNNIEDENGISDSRVKIIRDQSLGSYSWDSSTYNSGYGINQWGESVYQEGSYNEGQPYEGADIMRELNTDYLGDITVGSDGKWYSGMNNAKAANMPTSTLSEDAQNMIQEVKWNVGAIASSTKSEWIINNIYEWERGTHNGKENASGSIDPVQRTTDWIGKVALMYPSDYGYATTGGSSSNLNNCFSNNLNTWGSRVSYCKNNSWLLQNGQYTLSPLVSNDARTLLLINAMGGLASSSGNEKLNVRPTVYLKNTMYIASGDGSSEAPYRISSTSKKDSIDDIIINTPISSRLISLSNDNLSDLEYDGVDTLGDNGTNDNNLRFVGSSPNNYIYFNCSTTIPSQMSDDTCEKWRIIGLFNNIEDENGISESRVKIIRDQPIGNYSWDSSSPSSNYGYGINQWGESVYQEGSSLAGQPYEGADLMRELNTDYLGNITVGSDGYWYNGEDEEKTVLMPEKVLNQNAQDMIQTVKWNTGAADSSDYSNWLTKNVYEYERSENTGKACTSGNFCTDKVVRTTTWVGKVALMYLSDYGYSTSGGSTTNKTTCITTTFDSWDDSNISDCRNNSWLYKSDYNQKMLTSKSNSSDSSLSLIIRSSGDGGSYHSFGVSSINPTLFLKSQINIYSGNGSSRFPYKLVLNQ